jgi:hypothetical protein
LAAVWTFILILQVESWQGYLGRIDLLEELESSLQGSRAWSLAELQQSSNQRYQSFLKDYRDMGLGSLIGSRVPVNLLIAIQPYIPRGWYHQNMVSIARTLETNYLDLVDVENHRMQDREFEIRQAALRQAPFTPYNVLGRAFLFPELLDLEPGARAQSYINLAMVGCALERYRLANQIYPESLDALVPSFLERLPHDLITGRPPVYRKLNADGYALHVTGWDGMDPQGKPATSEEGPGDWVWMVPGVRE